MLKKKQIIHWFELDDESDDETDDSYSEMDMIFFGARSKDRKEKKDKKDKKDGASLFFFKDSAKKDIDDPEQESKMIKMDIIDLYMKQGLFDKGVYFVQLRSVDSLLYRLIKFRYLKNGIYNGIWLTYKKWFDMGLIEWVRKC